MKINKSIEKADGSFVFQGTVEGPELDFLVEYAINDLAMKGALPYLSTKRINFASIMDSPEGDQ